MPENTTPHSYSEIAAAAHAVGLAVFGGFSTAPSAHLPEGTKSLILFSPQEPGFWNKVTSQPEFLDQNPDPIDRWSQRVITGIATRTGGSPLFPFGGPPYLPFISWAIETGRAWPSPVGMLVHDHAGLMISIRGAIALPYMVDLPATNSTSPCEICKKPCLTACPVGALGEHPYDVPACHAYLDSPAGQTCMTGGCLVRNICPVSQSFGRQPDQSAFHMRHFHK